MKKHHALCACSGCVAKRSGLKSGSLITVTSTHRTNGRSTERVRDRRSFGGPVIRGNTDLVPLEDAIEFPIKPGELEDLKQFVRRKRRDWPFVFSCNYYGDVWSFKRYGWTPESERDLIDGENALLDRIAAEVIKVRDLGGRFFINDAGVYFKTSGGYPIQIIRFRPRHLKS